MIHLDTAACSRPSDAVHAAQVAHLELEREIGAYVAEQRSAPLVDQARLQVCELLAVDAEVALTDSATRAFTLVVSLLQPQRAAVLPSEFGWNVDVLRAHGSELLLLDYDDEGRLRLDSVAAAVDGGAQLVVLDHVPSQRGVVQLVREAAQICRAAGVPLVVDIAQSLGHLDCTGIGATYYTGNSRKWLHGPRGVGFLVGADVRRHELRESAAAARVGFATAVQEIVSNPPFGRLAELGGYARRTLDGARGWRVVEPLDEPTALITLRPPAGVDVFRTKEELYERGFLVAAIEVGRSADLTAPVLRISPDAVVARADLDELAETLPAAAERR